MKDNDIFIAVIGGSDCPPSILKIAEEVGREIARRGAVLVCGGRGGVMEAACRGASAEGGLTVGILPGENRQAANPYVRIPIVTGLGHARNVAVVKSARAILYAHRKRGGDWQEAARQEAREMKDALWAAAGRG